MNNHTYNKLDDILQAEYKRGYEAGYAARKEAEQKRKEEEEEIKVGDEVYSDAFDDKGIVTHITADKVNCVCIICNGSTMMKVGAHGLHKTGRTVPQIAEVFEQMQ